MSIEFEPFVSVEDAQPTGSKHDSGKPLMGAVPPKALLAVAKVLTFGAEKYGRDNWRLGVCSLMFILELQDGA